MPKGPLMRYDKKWIKDTRLGCYRTNRSLSQLSLFHDLKYRNRSRAMFTYGWQVWVSRLAESSKAILLYRRQYVQKWNKSEKGNFHYLERKAASYTRCRRFSADKKEVQVLVFFFISMSMHYLAFLECLLLKTPIPRLLRESMLPATVSPKMHSLCSNVPIFFLSWSD